jgi:acylphosphatase
MSRSQRGFRVSGRVQGVGFRWFTQAKARELGLEGTVRNLLDGAVEVHMAGPAAAVAEMTAWLGEGPSSARVDALDPIPSDQALPFPFEIAF